MKIFENQPIKILSLSFLFIFLGFTGVERYLTAFFSETGEVNVGFFSLILIYLFFLLFDPISAIFVSKYGAKNVYPPSFLFDFSIEIDKNKNSENSF